MDEPIIKLCPICGNEPDAYKGDGSWYVWCGKCFVRSFDYDLKNIAIFMWNMFVDRTKVRIESEDE